MPKKTLTQKALAANRLNAKRSTGPRTERGKNHSKFNAVKTGLFANHVVIPKCDGDPYEDDDPEEQFSQTDRGSRRRNTNRKVRQKHFASRS